MSLEQLFDNLVEHDPILLTSKKHLVYRLGIVIRINCHDIPICWISCPLHLIAELFHYKLFLSKSALFEESLDNVEFVGIWILHQEYLTRGTSIQIFVVDKVEVSEV